MTQHLVLRTVQAGFWVLILICLVLVSGCSTLPENTGRVESYSLDSEKTATRSTLVSDLNQAELQSRPGQSGVILLDDGLDAFVARVVMVQNAASSIDSQYYLFHNDQTGRIFTYQLLEAASRGVRVRLLVDDMDQAGRDYGAAILDSYPGIEVRIFNPFSRNTPRLIQFLTRFGEVTRRMHNKSLTVDNQVSVLGGRNIGDEYFDATDEHNFADLDALVIGPVVNEISHSFDLYWNDELSYPISTLYDKPLESDSVTELIAELRTQVEQQSGGDYASALKNSKLAKRIRSGTLEPDWARTRAVYDKPEKLQDSIDSKKYHLTPNLAPSFNSVENELIIISPYFVPGKKGTRFLTDLARRGITVRVMTNSLSSTDVAVVHAGYIKYRKDLLRAGIEIHEVKISAEPETTDPVSTERTGFGGSSAASLHSKAFIFDRKQVFIGSLNLDPRSVYENTELGILVDSQQIAQQLSDWFTLFSDTRSYRLELYKNWLGMDKTRWVEPAGKNDVTWKHEPQSGFLLRTGINLIRFLPIESQL